MNDMKKNIRRVFWLYFLLFALLVAYLARYVLLDSKDIIVNSYNPRLNLKNNDIQRGDILDRNRNVLASSEEAGDHFDRYYPYGESFAHVVGFSGLGKAGVESGSNFHLEKVDLEIWQRIRNLQGEKIKGNSVVLTLDAELQEYVYERLRGKKGAVVVMEPSTGKILSMASFPAYDPNTLSENWDTIKDDDINSPLLNRATQGLYPPGSVFKILTAASMLEFLPDRVSEPYECNGVASFGENSIQCYDAKIHGEVDLDSAFAQSCNTYFADAGIEITAQRLREEAERLLFNQALEYPLEYSVSSFPLVGNAAEGELIQTAIGQGRTLVTPLHMAMIVSAVANGGIMMKPYVVDHTENFMGAEREKYLPRMLGEVLTTDEAERLTDMMIAVVNDGTGKRAAIEGVNFAAKTGSAQNPAGEDHGWFVAFAPAEDPKIAVSVLLENCGGSANTLEMSKEILQFALER